MAGFVVGRLNVLLTAEGSKFLDAMNRARQASLSTASSFLGLGRAADVSAKGNAAMLAGFGKTQSAFIAISNAAGAAGGQFARVAGAATSLVLTGLNPIALAATAAGVGIGMLVEHHRDAAAAASEHTEEEKKLTDEILRRAREERKARTGKSEDELTEVDLRKKIEELEASLRRKRQEAVDFIRKQITGGRGTPPINLGFGITPKLQDEQLLEKLQAIPRDRLTTGIRGKLEAVLAVMKEMDEVQRKLAAVGGQRGAEEVRQLDDAAKKKTVALRKDAEEVEVRRRLEAVAGDEQRAIANLNMEYEEELRLRGDIIPEQKLSLENRYDEIEASIRHEASLQREQEQLRENDLTYSAMLKTLDDSAAAEKELVDITHDAEAARIKATAALEREMAALEARGRAARRLGQIEASIRDSQRDIAEGQLRIKAARERQEDADMEAQAEHLGDVLAMEEERYQAVAELRRTDSERAIREAEVRYRDLLLALETHGMDTVELEREIARQVAMARGLHGNDPAAGFQARITQLREETSAWGQLGAQMADLATVGLSRGVVGALEQVARGTMKAKEAFREFGVAFAFDAARMIQQALLLRGILYLFPGLSVPTPAAPGAIPGAAHGGEFRVTGPAGVDNMLAMLRVSPGETIRVGNGANSAGVDEGGIHIALQVSQPVLADDQARKMSRGAKAQVVSTALTRSSHRGWRPGE